MPCGRSIAGAADAPGARAKAKRLYARLLELARDADSPRPELTRAKAYLAAS